MEARSINGNPDKQWASPFTLQGDCRIVKCGRHEVFENEWEAIPKDAKEVAGNLVLKGTQNSHALYGGAFKLFEHDGVTFLKVVEPTVLDHVKDMKTQAHAEHHAQWVPIGEYFVGEILEYSHLLEESRRIVD